MPRRVKVEGDLFHGRVPVGAAYLGRPFPGCLDILLEACDETR